MALSGGSAECLYMYRAWPADTKIAHKRAVHRALPLTFAGVKQAIALLLFCCSLCQCMLKLGVVAYYEYNKGYIAANLCENRSRPQLKCCGKCYLNKQLRRADNLPRNGAEKAGLPGKISWPESSPFVLPAQVLVAEHTPLEAASPRIGHYLTMALSGVSAAVFHPPRASYC